MKSVGSAAGAAGWMAIVFAAGCASVAGTSTQPIAVDTVCEGALVREVDCTLSNDKGRWTLRAPGTAQVSKSYGDLAVECRRDQAVGTLVLQSKNNGAVWGNVLAGGLIGYAVDSKSGAGFDYPSKVTVVLAPPCPGNAITKGEPE